MLAGMMSPVGLRTHIGRNNLLSVMLLIGFPMLLILLTYAAIMLGLGGGMMQITPDGYQALQMGSAPLDVYAAEAARIMPSIIPFVGAGAAAWYGVAYVSHQKLIDMATGARPITRKDHPDLYNMVENLCISCGMAVPHIRIIDSPAMNAYASGLKEGQYSVTFTRGLLERLDKHEVEAVAAHELSHIRHKDVRLLVIAVIFAGIISFVGEMMWRSLRITRTGSRNPQRKGAGMVIFVALAMAAIAYILAILIRFSLSRRREYMADAGAVQLTKKPDAMIRALERIRDGHSGLKAPAEVRAMFLENRSASFSGLFATHPPIERRILALQEYAGGQIDGQSGPPFWSNELPVAEPKRQTRRGPWGRRRGIPGPWGRR